MEGVVFTPPLGWYSGGIRVVFAGIRLAGAVSRAANVPTHHTRICPEHHEFLHGNDIHMKACVGYQCQEKWYSPAPVVPNIMLIQT